MKHATSSKRVSVLVVIFEFLESFAAVSRLFSKRARDLSLARLRQLQARRYAARGATS